jgi:hypothetical protein
MQSTMSGQSARPNLAHVDEVCVHNTPIVGTLDDGYLRKVPLPRAPRIQSPGHVTCATGVERDKSDTCYLQIPRFPTWSDLVGSHAGFARSTML